MAEALKSHEIIQFVTEIHMHGTRILLCNCPYLPPTATFTHMQLVSFFCARPD
jgi:hypothetical protein